MPNLTPDSPELIENLKRCQAQLRNRKSGRVHTVDFSHSSADIQDEHLLIIAKLQKPEVIDLSNCQITDAGITQLLSCESIKLLTLTGTLVSEEMIATLRKKMINCRIIKLD